MNKRRRKKRRENEIKKAYHLTDLGYKEYRKEELRIQHGLQKLYYDAMIKGLPLGTIDHEEFKKLTVGYLDVQVQLNPYGGRSESES